MIFFHSASTETHLCKFCGEDELRGVITNCKPYCIGLAARGSLPPLRSRRRNSPSCGSLENVCTSPAQKKKKTDRRRKKEIDGDRRFIATSDFSEFGKYRGEAKRAFFATGLLSVLSRALNRTVTSTRGLQSGSHRCRSRLKISGVPTRSRGIGVISLLLAEENISALLPRSVRKKRAFTFFGQVFIG